MLSRLSALPIDARLIMNVTNLVETTPCTRGLRESVIARNHEAGS
jgi:hypothetical protein